MPPFSVINGNFSVNENIALLLKNLFSLLKKNKLKMKIPFTGILLQIFIEEILLNTKFIWGESVK